MSSDSTTRTTMRCVCQHEIFPETTFPSKKLKKFLRCENCGTVNCTICLATHKGKSCDEYQRGLQAGDGETKMVQVSVPEPRRGGHRPEVTPYSSEHEEDDDSESGSEITCGNYDICHFTFILPSGATKFRCPWCLSEGTVRRDGAIEHKQLTSCAPTRRELEKDMGKVRAYRKKVDSSTEKLVSAGMSVLTSRDDVSGLPNRSGSHNGAVPRAKGRSGSAATEMCKNESRYPGSASRVSSWEQSPREDFYRQSSSPAVSRIPLTPCNTVQSKNNVQVLSPDIVEENLQARENASDQCVRIVESCNDSPMTTTVDKESMRSHVGASIDDLESTRNNCEYKPSFDESSYIRREVAIEYGMRRDMGHLSVEDVDTIDERPASGSASLQIHEDHFAISVEDSQANDGFRDDANQQATRQCAGHSQVWNATAASQYAQTEQKTNRSRGFQHLPWQTAPTEEQPGVAVHCKTPGCNGSGVLGIGCKEYQYPLCHQLHDVEKRGMASLSKDFVNPAPTQASRIGKEKCDLFISQTQCKEKEPHCATPSFKGQGRGKTNLKFDCPKRNIHQYAKCNIAHGSLTCRQYKLSLKEGDTGLESSFGKGQQTADKGMGRSSQKVPKRFK